jgi:hypothetical protein
LSTFEQILDGHDNGKKITKKQRIFLQQVFSTPVVRSSSFYAKRLGLKSRNSINQYKKAVEKRFGMSLTQMHTKYNEYGSRPKPEQPTEQVRHGSIASLLERARGSYQQRASSVATEEVR